MWTMAVHQAVIAAAVLVQNQVLAHQPHGFGRLLVHLRGGGKRGPVAPQQVAHQRVWADLHQRLVLLRFQHGLTASGRMPSRHQCWLGCDKRARNRPARTSTAPFPSRRPRPPSSATRTLPSTTVLWAVKLASPRLFAPTL